MNGNSCRSVFVGLEQPFVSQDVVRCIVSIRVVKKSNSCFSVQFMRNERHACVIFEHERACSDEQNF